MYVYDATKRKERPERRRFSDDVVHGPAGKLIECDDLREADNIEEVDGRHTLGGDVVVPGLLERRERLAQRMYHRDDRSERED